MAYIPDHTRCRRQSVADAAFRNFVNIEKFSHYNVITTFVKTPYLDPVVAFARMVAAICRHLPKAETTIYIEATVHTPKITIIITHHDFPAI
jgi:hypothetical protein